MDDMHDIRVMRKRVKWTIVGTASAGALIIGGALAPALVPGKHYEQNGDAAWTTVTSTLTTQTGRSSGVLSNVFGMKGHYEQKATATDGGGYPGQAPADALTDYTTTMDVEPPMQPLPAPSAPTAPMQQAVAPPMAMPPAPSTVQDQPNIAESSAGVVQVASQPVSTFAADVDTSSYSNLRKTILEGGRPQPDAVRVEEMVNYFRYSLPAAPAVGAPFSVTTDVTTTPWNSSSLLMRVALNGRVVPKGARPPANIVLLVDVSGSMAGDDRIELVKRSFSDMVDHLGPRDRVSIVTYADGAAVHLASTSNRGRIKAALQSLSTGGGTAGGEGLRLAYAQARSARMPGGINRVMIASDGDFNVGMSDTASLKAYIEKERDDGVTLTTLGVGGRFNDNLMETLADAGNGSAAFLDDDLEARKVLRDELESSIHMIAKDVKAQVEFNPAAVSSYRLVGYQNRRLAERSFDDDEVDAGEIGSGHQVTAIYEVFPTPGLGVVDVASKRRYAANRVRSETSGGQAMPSATSAGDEALSVKLRYKEPDGTTSRLLQTVVPVGQLTTASAPQGDTAFAAAVAGFGLALTGTIPARPDWNADAMVALAGSQTNAQRTEFIDMVRERGASVLQTQAPPEQVLTPMPVQVQTIPRPAPVATERVWVSDQPPLISLAWWLLLTSGLLAIWLGVLDRVIRRMEDDDTGDRPAIGGPYATGGGSPAIPAFTRPRISTTQFDKAVHAARVSSTTETVASLASLELAAEIAVDAAAVDGDIADEVETIVTRHAPTFLDEYVAARRRATHAHVADLETSMRRTADTLADRLRALLGTQSTRDVARMSEHEDFIETRHGGLQEPAL